MRKPFLHRASSFEELWSEVDFATMEIPERFNLGVACVDDQDPDAWALTVVAKDESSVSYTFGEVKERSNRLANGLAGLGVERGDVVAIVNPASLETAVAFMALFRMGAIALPMSSLFGPDALRYRLSNSEARAVITSTANAPKVREALAGRDGVDVIVIGEAETGAGERGFEELLAASSPAFEPADTGAEDPCLLIYTSGTTGDPKGALHAHRLVFGHITAFEAIYDFYPKPHDVIWSPADWAWIAGIMDILVPAWWYGVPVVADLDTVFSADRAVWLMREHKITLTLLPATALRVIRASGLSGEGLSMRCVVSGGEAVGADRAVWLMREHKITLTLLPATALRVIRASGLSGEALSMRCVVSGGEAVGADLLNWSQDFFGCIINEGFGQTELNACVGNCASVFPVKPGALGKGLPGTRVAILDDDGQPVVGQPGEIAIGRHHPNTMLEYWRNAEATKQKFHDDWLLTGDLGQMDEDGYVWFLSRKDDVINSAGYRIGPGEIEACLGSHPSVAMSAVIGVPDERRGEVPKAFVVVRPGVEATDELADELRQHVRTRLAGHEVPRQIVFLDDLPKTTTGKIMRRALRDT